MRYLSILHRAWNSLIILCFQRMNTLSNEKGQETFSGVDSSGGLVRFIKDSPNNSANRSSRHDILVRRSWVFMERIITFLHVSHNTNFWKIDSYDYTFRSTGLLPQSYYLTFQPNKSTDSHSCHFGIDGGIWPINVRNVSRLP